MRECAPRPFEVERGAEVGGGPDREEMLVLTGTQSEMSLIARYRHERSLARGLLPHNQVPAPEILLGRILRELASLHFYGPAEIGRLGVSE